MLLIEDVDENDKGVSPGNVYIRDDAAKDGEFLADRFGVNKKLLCG